MIDIARLRARLNEDFWWDGPFGREDGLAMCDEIDRLKRLLAIETRRADGHMKTALAAGDEIDRLRSLIESSRNICARAGGCIPRD